MTKILIVEDNFIASDETKDRLIKLGFTDCETAFTGEEAIEKAKKFQPDLILMDINLGEGIDGIEAAERIHQQQRVPIIYLTAYDDDATLKRAKITDPYAYIVKPFEEKELHRAIDIALYKHETEEQLRASEEKFKALFSSSPDAVLLADAETGVIVDANHSAAKLFEKPVDKIIGMHQRDLHPQDHEEQAEKTFNHRPFDHSSEAPPVEIDIITDNGHRKSVEIRGRLILLDGKEFVLGNFRDVTERKKAEKALQESLTKYQVLFESFPLGVTVTDDRADILEVNKRSEKLLGISTNDHTTRKIDGKDWKIIRPDGSPMDPEEYASVRALKENRLIENVVMGIVKDNDEVTWISVTAAPIPLEGYGVAIAYGDVTDQKKAEEALKMAEKAWRDSFNSLEDVMMIINTDYTVENINQNGLDLLGLPKEDVIGKKCYSLIHGIEQEDEHCPFKQVMKTGKVQSVERYENNFDRYFSVKSSPVFDETGEIVKFVDLMRDITELKSIEKELLEANATKDRFFSLVSHDIKNPLINLVYGNEIILENLDRYDKDRIRHFCEEMLESSQHLLDLLTELLAWAKFQRGKMEFEPKPLELQYVIASDVELLGKVAEQKEITVKNQVDDDVIAIMDYNMIRTVGRNLINNAIKFTAPGGEVIISALDQGRFVEVSVSDTGVGMTPEKVSRLFKIAEEGISTKGTNGEKGTGLGLILCKEFVEKHGGKIWGESEKGSGSTFRFTLPKAEKGSEVR